MGEMTEVSTVDSYFLFGSEVIYPGLSRMWNSSLREEEKVIFVVCPATSGYYGYHRVTMATIWLLWSPFGYYGDNPWRVEKIRFSGGDFFQLPSGNLLGLSVGIVSCHNGKVKQDCIG